MIKKVENINPKSKFLTPQGWRTPKFVWEDLEYGHRDLTKKGVKTHRERLIRLGITPNMTEDEAREHLKRRD